MKKIFYILILLFPIVVFASNEYEIENYRVYIEAEKNHTYKYQEELEVSFFGNEKSIIRNLNEDEHDFKVDKNYSIETNGTSIAKIYSNYDNATYETSFNTKDKELKNNYYEFIIKNNYDNDINNIEFKIKLPTSVNANNITIKAGKYNITDLVDFSVKGNTITGNYNKKISSEDEIKVIVD